MITNIENKKDTTKIVSLADIMEAIKKAKEDNKEMIKQLTELFLMDETVKLDINSPIYKFIKQKKQNHIIGLEGIMASYIRALTDNNHDMKSKLKEYLFKYISNVKEGIDNEYLINIIEDDKNLLKYIKESNSIESFEELLEGKSSKKDAKVITFPQDKISKDNVYTFNNPRGSSIAS